ncbi:MAG TPA: hypothetical protein VEI01_19960 [Terriglobales bacterium]|nr:hypothetical protein [Terriglobales bacterium]
MRTVLVDSFTATLAMPENQEEINQRVQLFASDDRLDQVTMEALYNLETKRRLQEFALTDLLIVDEAKVESLLPQAEPDVRANLLIWMISRATTGKRLDRAVELLNRVPPKENFPYGEATQLMLALPAERDTDKQEIFRLAMAADRQQQSVAIGGDDFASMIVRFWQHLHRALVLAAIHQVLDAAESREGSGVTLNTTSGTVGFTRQLDYRLFELLPILKQLDNDEADKLLKDSQQAQFQLKQFPSGLQSIDPTIRDTPAKEGERQEIGGSWGPPDKIDQISQATKAQVEEIERTAESNPRQAMATAATLPESVGPAWRVEFPRSQAYLGIARTLMTKNHSAAKDALEQMAESLEHTPHLYRAMDNWVEGIAISKKMDEVDLALKLFRSGMEQADKLRSDDADPDDPNIGLKGWWPSVSAYWRLVLAVSQFSPQTALEQVREIKDPEILLLLEVRLANRSLGAREDHCTTMVHKKLSRDSWSEERRLEE